MPDLRAIPGVRELWALTHGDPAVRVALVDGPIDLDHPCFDGAQIEVLAAPWTPPDGEPLSDDALSARREHATWVASVLHGQHGSEVAGLAPRCTGVVVPCLLGTTADVDEVNLARGIDAAGEAGCAVVCVELGIGSLSGGIDPLLSHALAAAGRRGSLLVVAAGNDRGEHISMPAASPHVLAVGAHDDDGRMFRFSNWGPHYDGHGLVAPGGNIAGAIPGGGTKVHRGTSGSAPVVAGVAALLVSLQVQRGAAPDPLAVRDALLATAAPCAPRDAHDEPRRCIDGRLDVAAATRRVLSQLRSGSRRPARAVATSAPSPRTGASDADAGRRPRAPASRPSPRTGATVADAGGRPPGPQHAGSPVFALGTLGWDFGSEARRDAFAALMARAGAAPPQPDEPRQLLAHLAADGADAARLIWTLTVDGAPAYALRPRGPYATAIYARLVRLAEAQLPDDDGDRAERVSAPGRLAGTRAQLRSGERVAVVAVDQLRGLHGLGTAALATAAAARADLGGVPPAALAAALRDYLTRVYVDLANLGRTSPERALNFAATNAYQAAEAFVDALARGLVLERIDTERSRLCRQDSDCWDVLLRFFDPDNGRRARRLTRFTIDVSEVFPVTLGATRSWAQSRPARAA